MTTPVHRHIIVGAGLAGAKAAQALRREGHGGPITLIGAEEEAPYNRPPLSKEYLHATPERGSINVHPDQWYVDHNIDLRLGTGVTELDAERHQVTLSNGEHLDFEKLLLTTGCRVRRLGLPGADLDNVMYLRTISDSHRIRHALSAASRIVVIGAGWVGLEVAAAARSHGVAVTLVEAAKLPLLAVLGPEVAQHFAALHVSHGVDLRCGVQPAAITGPHGRVTGVDLADGTHIACDAVIVGIGVTPRTELAQGAGLAVDDGVLVDASLRSSHPDVYAAGDVANAWHPLLGTHIRTEHWSSASWHPRVAAQGMLGADASHDRLPHFFSDQYDLSLDYTGYVGPEGYDRVVFRGDPSGEAWIAFWVRHDKVLAGMNVNMPRAIRDITTLIRSGRHITADALADDTRPLKSLLQR